jgi:ribosome biogenesis protein MAK21
MKSIIAREVSSLVLKPVAPAPSAGGGHVRFDDVKPTPKSAPVDKSDTQTHARYYGLITLNQITLARGDQELSGRLVDLYFEIFREILGEETKDEPEPGIEKTVGKVGKWEGRRKQGRKGRKGEDEKSSEMEGGDARLVAAVLTGINRAVPYAKLDDAV